jgi:phosphoribosylaminoimidazole (AIR) synthetase
MEMRRTFNMGIGMIIVVPEANADDTIALLSAERARAIGRIVPRAGGEASRYVGE